MPPSVSVIIPAFNAARYISKAIESVLNQTIPVSEVFVIDDGSADNTAEVASRFDSRVRVIAKPNGGPASARNLGASLAIGDWLAMLDADDWWFPLKNEVQLSFAGPEDVGLIHTLFDHRSARPPAELTFRDLWATNWIGNSSVLIRRSMFENLGGFNEDRSLISVEDYNLWLRIAAAGWKIVTCPHILVHYTQGIGISSNYDRLMNATLANLNDIAHRLALPADMVSSKRMEIDKQFGLQALHDRRSASARVLLSRAFRHQPSIRNALHLLTTTIPTPLLNTKRILSTSLSHFGFSGKTSETATAQLGLHEPIVPVDEAPFWDRLAEPMPILRRKAENPTSSNDPKRPMLVTTIDAEEDFDWNGPFFRSSSKVTSMRSQHVAHRVFEKFGVVPTYLVDYPVASQDEGRAPLRELLRSGVCEIGAQLHPWVTPPFVEDVSVRNSYPGNLPFVVEYDKLSTLTRALNEAFGIQPRIYRAGRCGVGANTGAILKRIGYEVDTSVMPHWDYRGQGGADFRAMTADPFWIDDEKTLLELPISAALVGRAAQLRPSISPDLFGAFSRRIGLTPALARLGLIERIRLTPEGITVDEAKRLLRHMAATGHKVFVLTYHSPSLEPGNTPYVRTSEDLTRFLRWLEEIYDFFTTEIGGICASWRDVRATLQRKPEAP